MESEIFKKEIRKVNGAIRFETSNESTYFNRESGKNLNQLAHKNKLIPMHSSSQPMMLRKNSDKSIVSTNVSS